ncbi:hypothetical protein Baya_5640 [Bagarius yarrelli]|uniref:Uncharacterized protein n=1 Tax=Bagarius yarrelli TaxID=175774 RepID=A0A556TWC8_BAGYA|nr:hypothetical protein Baya_5640 [Bagarius yarrelli]
MANGFCDGRPLTVGPSTMVKTLTDELHVLTIYLNLPSARCRQELSVWQEVWQLDV